MPPPEPAEPAGEHIPLNIVYEDDDIIVIDKPAGLVVHPAAGHASGTLVNALIAHCGDSLSGIGGVKRPGIVHRLDKDTTGLMVVAKNDRAHQSLAAQFADHGRTGPLRARLSGVRLGRVRPARRAPSTRRSTGIRKPRQDGGARERPRGRSPIGRCWRRYPGADGKPVASLIACRLDTGRTHQIRVHLAHIGHPLLGDATYATGFRTKAAQLAARRPGRPWRTLEDRPCMLIYWPSNTQGWGRSWSSARNCRPTWLVYITALTCIADARQRLKYP